MAAVVVVVVGRGGRGGLMLWDGDSQPRQNALYTRRRGVRDRDRQAGGSERVRAELSRAGRGVCSG